MNYWFCQQIDRHICFNRDYISSCTVGNNSKCQSLPIIRHNYKGEPIDWDCFFEEREKIKQECKNGNTFSNCIGCQYLTCDDWDNINTKREFKYIQFSHWLACNSQCIYCGNHTDYDKTVISDTYDSVPILKDLIAKGYVNENTKVDFAGGEPTLYYRFNDLLKLLIDANVKEIIIHTNAIIFSKEIERGIKNGNVSICVSLDAGSKKKHAEVKGVKSYEKVWKNIIRYSSAKNKLKKNYISLKYIIIPQINDTEEEITLWMNKAEKANVDLIILNADNNIYINKNTDKDFEHKIKRVVELSEFYINKAKEKNLKYRFEFNVLSAYIMQNIKVPSQN